MRDRPRPMREAHMPSPQSPRPAAFAVVRTAGRPDLASATPHHQRSEGLVRGAPPKRARATHAHAAIRALSCLSRRLNPRRRPTPDPASPMTAIPASNVNSVAGVQENGTSGMSGLLAANRELNLPKLSTTVVSTALRAVSTRQRQQQRSAEPPGDPACPSGPDRGPPRRSRHP
jgi:hypothetical protein